MSTTVLNTGWSMFPTFRPDDTLEVEPATADDLGVGDVAVVSRGESLVTHRIVGWWERGPIISGDLDPSSEWEGATTADVLGRVVDVERTARDAPSVLSTLWYWESLTRLTFGYPVRTRTEWLFPLLAALVARSVGDGDGREVSLRPSSAERSRWSVERAAERYAALYETVADAVEESGLSLPSFDAGSLPDRCWYGDRPVRLVEVEPTADAIAELIRQSRRDDAVVLPHSPSGECWYPRLVGTSDGAADDAFALPCTSCTADRPTCRTRADPSERRGRDSTEGSR